MLNYCKCGCGKEVKKGRKYILGHNQRNKTYKKTKEQIQKSIDTRIKNGTHISSEEKKEKLSLNAINNPNYGMKGKKHSIENKKIWSQKQKGKKHTSESKQKISSSMKIQYKLGIINLSKNRKNSEEYKQKMSNALKGRKITWGDKISKTKKLQLLLGKIPNAKCYNTKPEKEMKKILDALNIKYIQQYPIMNICHKYSSDFYIPEKKLIIEVDGKYWHNYPIGKDIDKVRNKELKENGYNILRFWENEFNINTVKEALKNVA